MIAGLPNRCFIVAMLLIATSFVSGIAVAQELQTPPTTLEPIIDALAANAATTEQQRQLADSFAAALDTGLMLPDQVLEMLEFLGWESLESSEDIELAIALLTETVSALLAGTVTNPLAALTDAYNAELAPDGIVNAIVKAGASDETISKVQALVAAGLPRGIVLRVTKDALREGKDPAEALAALADAYGDPTDPSMSPGQAANQATGRGSYKYQEQEEEQNANEGVADGPEEEANQNGPRETGQDKEKEDKGGKKK